MMTREYAWEKYVQAYDIEVPQDLVENELQYMILEYKHRMQYDTLATGAMHFFTQEELEAQAEELQEAAYLAAKSDLVMKVILAQQNFPVTREELEAEAEAMARRQETTVEMIKGFFGEDLFFLEKDLKQRKAMDWARDQLAAT